MAVKPKRNKKGFSNNRKFSNILSSVKNSSFDAVKQLNPAINNTLTNNKRYIAQKYNSVKDNVTTGSVKDNFVYRSAEELIRNSINDLKSGNLYNNERSDDNKKKMLADMGFDFDEVDESSFDEEIDDQGNNIINNVKKTQNVIINNGTDPSTIKTLGTISNTVIRGNSLGFSSISNSLNTMITFQNEQTSRFYDDVSEKITNMSNSIANMEQVVAGIGQIGLGTARASTSNDDIGSLTDSNGFQLEHYGDKIKNYMKDSGFNDYVEDGTLKAVIGSIVANPLGTLMTAGMKKMVPKNIKKSMKELNTSIDFLPMMLNYKMKDMANKGSIPFANELFDILGTKTQLKKKFEFSKYEKGAVKYDGITRKSIVNVIPSLLSKILSSVSNNKIYQKELVYDYDSGKFTNKEAIETEFNTRQRELSVDSRKTQKYKSEVLNKMGKKNITPESFNKIDEAFNNIINNGLLINDKTDNMDISSDNDISNLIKNYVMGLNGHERKHFQRNMLEALEKKNRNYTSIEGNESYQNAFDIDLDNVKIGKKNKAELFKEKLKNMKGANLLTDSSSMRDDLLNDGFNIDEDTGDSFFSKIIRKTTDKVTNVLMGYDSKSSSSSKSSNIDNIIGKKMGNILGNSNNTKVNEIKDNIRKTYSNMKSGSNNIIGDLDDTNDIYSPAGNIRSNKFYNYRGKTSNVESKLSEISEILKHGSDNNNDSHMSNIDKNLELFLNAYLRANSKDLNIKEGFDTSKIKFGDFKPNNIFGRIKGYSKDKFNMGKGAIKGIGGNINGIFGKLKDIKSPMDFIKGIGNSIIEGISGGTSGKSDKGIFKNMKSPKGFIEGIFKRITGGVENITKSIKGLFTTLSTNMGKVGNRLLTFVEKTLPTTLEFVDRVSSKVWKGIKDTTKGVMKIGGKVYGDIKSGASSVGNAILGRSKNVPIGSEKNNRNTMFISGGNLDSIREIVRVVITDEDKYKYSSIRKSSDAEKLENQLANKKTDDISNGNKKLLSERFKNMRDKLTGGISSMFKDASKYMLTMLGGTAIGGGIKKGMSAVGRKFSSSKFGSKVVGGKKKYFGGALKDLSIPSGATPVYVVGGHLDGSSGSAIDSISDITKNVMGKKGSSVIKNAKGMKVSGKITSKSGKSISSMKSVSEAFKGKNVKSLKSAKGMKVLGKAGDITDMVDTVGSAKGILGKLTGEGGKLGKLVGKVPGGKSIGKLVGKTGKLGKIGKLGKLGKIGKIAGGLGKFGKFLPGLGIALTAADALGGGLSGWKDAGNIFGTDKATTGQKVSGALGGALNSLSFGLVPKSFAAKGINGAGSIFSGIGRSMTGKNFIEGWKEGGMKEDSRIIDKVLGGVTKQMSIGFVKGNSSFAKGLTGMFKNVTNSFTGIFSKGMFGFFKPDSSGKSGFSSVWDKSLNFLKGKGFKTNDEVEENSKGGSSGSSGGSGGSVDVSSDIYKLSDYFETSAEGARKVSSGVGDYGGKSYGIPQFSLTMGSLKSYVNSLANTNPDWYAKLSPHALGSSGFDAAWKSIADTDKDAFSKSQVSGIINGSYKQSTKMVLDSIGLDISKRSKALQSVFFSTVVQHGAGGARGIFRTAVGKEGVNLTDEEIISKVYDERGRGNGSAHFFSSDKPTQISVANRFKREKTMALEMLSKEKSGGGGSVIPEGSGFAGGGSSGGEVSEKNGSPSTGDLASSAKVIFKPLSGSTGMKSDMDLYNETNSNTQSGTTFSLSDIMGNGGTRVNSDHRSVYAPSDISSTLYSYDKLHDVDSIGSTINNYTNDYTKKHENIDRYTRINDIIKDVANNDIEDTNKEKSNYMLEQVITLLSDIRESSNKTANKDLNVKINNTTNGNNSIFTPLASGNKSMNNGAIGYMDNGINLIAEGN